MTKPERIAPVEPILRKNILTLAAAYARHRDLKFSTLSGYCHGDPPFLDNLKKGGGFTGRKYDVVIKWFWKKWPADLPWPLVNDTLADTGGGRRRAKAVQNVGTPA